MLPLTKLISTGLTGLSTLGLGAYFTPGLLLDEGESSNVIYSLNEKEMPLGSLTKLTDNNKEVIDSLTKLFSDYSNSIHVLIDAAKKEHKTITEFFQQVQESETKLKELYEKNKGYLEKFQEFIKTYHDTSAKKLQIEQLLQQAKYWNKSLLSLGNVVSGWGLSIEKLLCAINDQKGEKSCATVTQSWLNSTATYSIPQTTGGGTDASTDALKKLKEASEKLQTEKDKLKQLFTGIGAMNFISIQKQHYLEQKNSAYEKGLLALQELQQLFNQQIQKVDQESSSETTKLNENYNKLQDSISKWEKFKQFTSFIYKWKGSLQNSICELDSNLDSVDCFVSKNF